MDLLVILFIIISLISSITKNIKKHTKKGPIFDPWSFDADRSIGTNDNQEKITRGKIQDTNKIETVLFENAEQEKKKNDSQEDSAFIDTYLIEENNTVDAIDEQIEDAYQDKPMTKTVKKKNTVEVTEKVGKGLEFILKKDLASGILISEILGPPRSKRGHFSKKLIHD
ncbi:MAG: hypothetical protein PHD33_02720 [Atribacterota bacterium]|nr:hypothetical protein [Atribacterota bacterium]